MNRHILLAAVLAALAAPLAAQTWPVKPVRIVVPYPPGGSNDVLGRHLAQKLTPVLGHNVLVDNRAGASGAIGADHVAKSAPDGYTLKFNSGSFAASGAAEPKLPFDTERDFIPIAGTGVGPMLLLVHPSLPAKGVKELVALTRSRPGALNYSSSGTAGINHLATEMFRHMAKIDIVHVPYKGSAPAITDAVGGHVEMLFVGISSAAALVSGGRLRAVATGSARRLPMIPDVPTFIEAGYPDVTTSVWFGLLAPAATPPAIVARLNSEIDRILTSAEVRDRLIADGQEPGGGTAAEFGRFVKSEIDRYARVVKAAGLRAE